MPPLPATDHDLIVEMHSILCGNGNKGLCQAFEDHKQEDREFRREFYNFKRTMLMLAAFLVGTGSLGLGIFQLLSAGG